MGKNVVQSAARDLQDMSLVFRKSQSQYLKRKFPSIASSRCLFLLHEASESSSIMPIRVGLIVACFLSSKYCSGFCI